MIGHAKTFHFILFTDYTTSMLIDVIQLPMCYEHFLAGPDLDGTVNPGISGFARGQAMFVFQV